MIPTNGLKSFPKKNFFAQTQKNPSLKGLSYEIDVENVDEN